MRAALFLAPLIFAGSTPAQHPREAEPCTTGPRYAAVRAKVSREPEGTPLPGVGVATNLWAGTTDSGGVACIRELDPGRHQVIARRVGWIEDSTAADLKAGGVARVSLILRRRPPPCCSLEGSWRLEIRVDTPAALYPDPRARAVAGTVVFSRRVPDPMPRRFELDDPVVRYEFGRHAVDFTPVFGGPVAPDRSTTIFGGGASLAYEVVGLIESGDSVYATIIPRMSHGGLSLRGRIFRDTVAGTWSQNAYCCGAHGTFVMVRQPWTPEADSLVDLSVTQDAQERREAAAADSAWHLRAGEFRIRTFDEATNRYVEADYWLARLDDDPEDRLYTSVASDSDGWSPYRGEEPGTYAVELFSYACGDRTWFADTTYVRTEMPRLEVEIRSGERAELDVRIDSRAIRASPSYDNRKGLRCTR